MYIVQQIGLPFLLIIVLYDCYTCRLRYFTQVLKRVHTEKTCPFGTLQGWIRTHNYYSLLYKEFCWLFVSNICKNKESKWHFDNTSIMVDALAVLCVYVRISWKNTCRCPSKNTSTQYMVMRTMLSFRKLEPISYEVWLPTLLWVIYCK